MSTDKQVKTYTQSDYAQLVKQLHSLAEEKYRVFQSALIPGVDGILGVRAPTMRALAKEIAKGDFRGYLAAARDDTHEEMMLQAFVIGLTKMPIEEKIGCIRRFVPRIVNWAVCDTFAAALKDANMHPKAIRAALAPYLESQEEYVLRFGLVMLLMYYVTPDAIDDTLSHLRNVRHEAYYVKMAAAWALAECFTKQREETLPLFTSGELDLWIHNKAIQKICESFRVTEEDKAMLRALKRKDTQK